MTEKETTDNFYHLLDITDYIFSNFSNPIDGRLIRVFSIDSNVSTFQFYPALELKNKKRPIIDFIITLSDDNQFLNLMKLLVIVDKNGKRVSSSKLIKKKYVIDNNTSDKIIKSMENFVLFALDKENNLINKNDFPN